MSIGKYKILGELRGDNGEFKPSSFVDALNATSDAEVFMEGSKPDKRQRESFEVLTTEVFPIIKEILDANLGDFADEPGEMADMQVRAENFLKLKNAIKQWYRNQEERIVKVGGVEGVGIYWSGLEEVFNSDFASEFQNLKKSLIGKLEAINPMASEEGREEAISHQKKRSARNRELLEKHWKDGQKKIKIIHTALSTRGNAHKTLSHNH